MEKENTKISNGNKIVLALAILLFLASVTYSTFAIFRSSTTGTSDLHTAKFVVKVNGDNVQTHVFELDLFSDPDIWHTNSAQGVRNSAGAYPIAPGAYGEVPLVIDATQSEVGVDYEVTGEIYIEGEGEHEGELILDTVASESILIGDYVGSVLYGEVDAGEIKEDSLFVLWDSYEYDDDDRNESDLSLSGKKFIAKVYVTVKQMVPEDEDDG